MGLFASPLLFASQLLGAMIAAAILHELTHVVAVVAVGGELRSVSLLSLDVYWALAEHEPLWKDRIIGLAPLSLGLLLGIIVAIAGVIPSGRVGIVAGVAWGIYTLFGGLEDYQTYRTS